MTWTTQTSMKAYTLAAFLRIQNRLKIKIYASLNTSMEGPVVRCSTQAPKRTVGLMCQY